jgi:transcriptional regulator with XRE-family HTH domain
MSRHPKTAKPRKRKRRAADESLYLRGAGDVIRRHREERGLTLDALATTLGVDKSTVSRWETNESPLSDRAIKRLAKAFRVRMDVLMLECLEQIRPRFKDSPFGRLMRSLVESIDLPADDSRNA